MGAISGWVERAGWNVDALKTGIGVAILFPVVMLAGILLLKRAKKN